MEIQRIKHSKISEEIVNQLKHLIQTGYYPQDSKLPSEKELAAQFGVSRVSIREALSILAAAKIIEIRHGEGSFVQNINLGMYLPPLAVSLVASPDQVLHLIEVRMALEISAARFAASRASSADLLEMESACDGYLAETEAGMIGEASDLRFHLAIANATYNPVFAKIMGPLVDLIREGMRYTLGKNVGNLARMKEVYSEHINILTAIKRKNPKEAEEAMEAHLTLVRRKVVQLASAIHEQGFEKVNDGMES